MEFDCEGDCKEQETHDMELLNLQRRKSRPQVVIQEFVQDEEDEDDILKTNDGSLSGTHREVTHVEVAGDSVSLKICSNLIFNFSLDSLPRQPPPKSECARSRP